MDDKRRRFEDLALPHLDSAYNLARWLCRSPAEAEDIVQDAMLRAFRGIDGFRGRDIKPWLLQIVRNCWRNEIGRKRRHAAVPLADEKSAHAIASDQPDPEMEALQRADGRRLDLLLDALPAEFREVLILREMEDMSYREIAQAIEAPIGTVMSRLARARALLKERWIAEGGTP